MIQTLDLWAIPSLSIALCGLIMCLLLLLIFRYDRACYLQKLAAAEKDLKLTLDAISDGVWDWNAVTDQVSRSASWYKMLEYEPFELAGTVKTWQDVIHPDDLERVMQLFNAHVYGTAPMYEAEYRCQTKTGQWKWIIDRGTVVERDAQGRPLRMIGAHCDIHQRKLAEQKLKDYQDNLENLIQTRTEKLLQSNAEINQTQKLLQQAKDHAENLIKTANVMIVGLDQDGCVQLFNQEAEKITGYSSAEIQGKKWFETVVPKNQYPEVWQEFQKLQQQNAIVENFENSILTKSQQEKYIVWQNSIWQEHGQAIGTLSFGLDITQRKHAELQLQQAKEAAEIANQTKTQFLAHVSHELRTPLNGILGFTQILQKNAQFSPQQQQQLNIIHQCSDHLLTLINDILNLSKIELGKIELEYSVFSLGKLMDSLVKVFSLRAKEIGSLQFYYQASGSLPEYVYSDENKLRQVLINLINNAIKFTPQGSVTLKVSYADEMAHFEVIDTGIGIAAENLTKIFQPFQQLKQIQAEGVGLGLAISQKITALLAGDLTVSSQLGQGSCFGLTLKLPAAQPLLAATTPSKPIVGYQGQRRKILLVDDNPVNLYVLQTELSDLNFSVKIVESGQQCLAEISTFEPDLILMDIVMPGLNGLETTIKIRQRHYQQPIIAVSANAFAEDKQESLTAGCDDFIAKPVDFKQLLSYLEKHLHLQWLYQKTSQNKLRLLIADDSEINRMIFKAQLEDEENLEFIEAENGQQTLDLILQQRFDAIFLDLNMPLLNGDEVVEKLQHLYHPNKNIPIIAVTGNDDDGLKQRLLNIGFTGLITKPLDTDKIIAVVRNCDNR